MLPVAPAAAITADDHRIEYRRGALAEWYDNRPEGLEQGFTLAAPLAPRGGNSWVLPCALRGADIPARPRHALVLDPLHLGKARTRIPVRRNSQLRFPSPIGITLHDARAD